MTYKGRAVVFFYIAQIPCNVIAGVWAMQMGGSNEGMVDSCTHKNK